MSSALRSLTGSAALACAAYLLTAASAADAPQLPKDVYKKAAAADIKFIQTRLTELAGGAEVKDAKLKPAVAAALAVAVYADHLGDPDLRKQSLKLAEDLSQKNRNVKAAAEAAKKLALKPGGAAGKGGALPKVGSDEKMLEYSMQMFRGKAGGGLNLERDIKDYTSKKTAKPIDAAEIEVLAARTAASLAIASHYPNETARKSPADTKQWEKWCEESVDLSKQIATEAAKGKGADEKSLRSLLGKLDARCTDCHGKYRD